jgi:hypothetical protein
VPLARGAATVPPVGRSLLASLASLLALTAAARTGAAQDQPTLSGAWTASALTERWSVTTWGEACGPRPAPQGAPGGAVQIKQQGSELSISGAGRTWSTSACWEQMPGLTRSMHSASGNARSWQTRCTTPANDPRRATVTTSTQATDTTLQMVENGQYQFIIQDTTCSASVTRSRSYTLVRREGDVPAAASAAASAPPPAASAPEPPAPTASEVKPATPRACDTPGEAARLEVTPSRKIMRPGERFQFRAVVMDADGCALSTRPTWSIAPGPLAAAATVEPGGALTVAASAGEGKLGLVAAVGGKGVTVTIDVTSPDRYDAFLAMSGLNDAGESDQASAAVIATGTIGGRITTGEDVARERKNVFVAIVGGVAACLGFVGLVLLRRGRRRPALDAEDEGGERAEGGERVDAETEREGAPAPSFGATRLSAGMSRDAGVPPGGGAAASVAQKRGKICPTCGEHYPGEAMFCGKDGTQLVPLN